MVENNKIEKFIFEMEMGRGERAELVREAASVDSDGGSGDWTQCKDVRGPSLIR